jgi:hypothetical protein
MPRWNAVQSRGTKEGVVMMRGLALQLLESILPDPPWDEDHLQALFRDLEVLAEHKYNNYEMYQPGRLFLENLYLWLSCFSKEERTAALEFVQRDLIFITREEFHQLAHILYHEIYQRQLDCAAQLSRIPRHRVRALADSPVFQRLQRASLYVALSDGARIDYFRRQNLEIGNEQVITTYSPSPKKVRQLVADLEKRCGSNTRFQCLVLLDDFCGSGRTLLREVVRERLPSTSSSLTVPEFLKADLHYDEQEKELAINCRGDLSGEREATILSLHSDPMMVESLRRLVARYKKGETELAGTLQRIADSELRDALADDVSIFLCPLLATEYAIGRLKPLVPRLPTPLSRLVIVPGAVVPETVRISPGSGGMAALCEKYYDPSLADEHTGSIKYGYDGCGLPLVLHHNTPNNSPYLLWSRKLAHALFVRYERHGREMS